MQISWFPGPPAKIRASVITGAQREANRFKAAHGHRPASAVIHVDADGRFVKLEIPASRKQ